MKSGKEIDLVEVFAGNPWQTAIVKTLLEDADIQVFFKDEFLGTLTPWWVDPGGAGPVKVLIADTDFENARLIVAEYEKNAKSES